MSFNFLTRSGSASFCLKQKLFSTGFLNKAVVENCQWILYNSNRRCVTSTAGDEVHFHSPVRLKQHKASAKTSFFMLKSVFHPIC